MKCVTQQLGGSYECVLLGGPQQLGGSYECVTKPLALREHVERARPRADACVYGSVAKAQDDTLIGPSEVSLNYW
jgi:hypothetical protein